MEDYSDTIHIIPDSNNNHGRLKVDLAKNNILGIKSESEITKVITIATMDEPRLFHVSTIPRATAEGNSSAYAKDSLGNITLFYLRIEKINTFNNTTYAHYENYKKDLLEMHESMFTIISGIKNTSMTVYQKLASLQEKYLATVSYSMNGSPDDMLGSFLNIYKNENGFGRVLCEGYARSFLYLLQRIGFQGVYIAGMADSDGNGAGLHAWNKVNVAGSWYNIDTTWDDSIDATSTTSLKNHFLKADKDFTPTHEGPNIATNGAASHYKRYGIALPTTPLTSVLPEEYN